MLQTFCAKGDQSSRTKSTTFDRTTKMSSNCQWEKPESQSRRLKSQYTVIEDLKCLRITFGHTSHFADNTKCWNSAWNSQGFGFYFRVIFHQGNKKLCHKLRFSTKNIILAKVTPSQQMKVQNIWRNDRLEKLESKRRMALCSCMS